MADDSDRDIIDLDNEETYGRAQKVRRMWLAKYLIRRNRGIIVAIIGAVIVIIIITVLSIFYTPPSPHHSDNHYSPSILATSTMAPV